MAGAAPSKDHGNPIFNYPGVVASILTVALLFGFVFLVVSSASGHAGHGSAPSSAPAAHLAMRRAPLVFLGGLLLFGGTACARREMENSREVSPPQTRLDETPGWEDGEVLPRDRFSPTDSKKALFWAWLLPAGGALAWAWFWERLHRQHADEETRRVQLGALRNGPTVLRGVVETEDGLPAVVVTILQKRRVHKDKQGNSQETWVEVGRDLSVRPFWLSLEDQQRVRVVPDLRVLLRDTVEPPEPLEGDRQRRCVRLRHGERAWVTGQLEGVKRPGGAGAYREDTAPPPVLRPERLESMILSTEPPGAYFSERADLFRSWRRGILVLALLLHGTLLGDFSLLALSGRTEPQEIHRIRSWKEWVKPKNGAGRWVAHFAVEAGRPDDLKEYEVHPAFFRCVDEGRCHTLPVTRAWLSGGLLRRAGRGATLHDGQIIVSALLGWGLLIAFVVHARTSRPWYAGGKVNEPARRIG
jgi:hypothetical protein